MLYTIYMWVVIIILTVFWGGTLLPFLPFDRKGNIYWFFSRTWARMIVKLSRVKFNIHGLARLDPGQPFVYMSNHQTYFDVICLAGYLPVPARFVAKKELLYIPVFGQAMWGAGHIIVDRGNTAKAVAGMKKAGDKIRRGTSILVFPEGTRSADHKLGPFKKGGFMLALEAGVPIVPISITGTSPMMPKGSYRFRKSDVDIYIREPIPVSGYSELNKEELMARTRQAIIEGFPDQSQEALANMLQGVRGQ